MNRISFKYWARKGVKVKSLHSYGQVETLWGESKRKAIRSCREYNHRQNYQVYFVTPIIVY